jgi:uncharacterized protein with PQ loop repeat
MIAIIFSIFQIIGSILLLVGEFPQALKIIRTKSVKDLSLYAYTIFFIGFIMCELYAGYLLFTLGVILPFITGLINIALMAIIIILILKYRK